MKTQKPTDKAAIRLLKSILITSITFKDSAVDNSNNFTQNNKTIKHIDDMKNGLIDSKYFFIILFT